MPTIANSSAVSDPPAIDAGLARRAAQTTRQITAVLADRPGVADD